MPLTVDGEKLVLPLLLGKEQTGSDGNRWLALFDADDNELNGFAYARVQIPYASNWTVNADGSVQNATAISFPEATGGDWAAYTAFKLMTAATGGNVICDGEFNGSKVVRNGDTESLAPGTLVFDFDNT